MFFVQTDPGFIIPVPPRPGPVSVTFVNLVRANKSPTVRSVPILPVKDNITILNVTATHPCLVEGIESGVSPVEVRPRVFHKSNIVHVSAKPEGMVPIVGAEKCV